MTTTTSSRVVSRATRSINTRHYGTRFRLFSPEGGRDELRFLGGTPIVHPNMGGNPRLDPAGQIALESVFSIDGICSVIMRPFDLSVSRFSAFEWDDLDPTVSALIAAADPQAQGPQISAVPDVQFRRRIRWFDTRSSQCRHYGLTARLFTPAHCLDTERNWPWRGEQEFTPQGRALIEEFAKIDGISHVNFRAFEANVCKYDHFTFTELHEPVLEALRSVFPDRSPVEVSNRNQWDY